MIVANSVGRRAALILNEKTKAAGAQNGVVIVLEPLYMGPEREAIPILRGWSEGEHYCLPAVGQSTRLPAGSCLFTFFCQFMNAAFLLNYLVTRLKCMSDKS